MDRFVDRVIVITGGGAGLGRLCAQMWADEGGQIVVTDLIEQRALRVAKEIEDAGATAVGIRADVTRESDVAAAVDLAVSTWGRLDVMFANAGKPVAGNGTIALEDFTEEQWNDVNDVVFKGVFFSAKQACRVMKQQGGGNIVVTASAAALNAYPGFGAYVAGKAGAVGLIRAMAYDWGRFGIRVNGLAPVHGMSTNFVLPPDAEVTGLSYEEAALAQSGAAWDPQTMFPDR